MKKSFGLLILGLMLVGCSTTMLSKNKEEYSCKNLNGKVAVEYLENGEKLKVKTSVNEMLLNRSVSASGSYYQNGQNSFHTNGKTAILEINSIETSCGIIK